jgi:hypothetical protein
MDVANESRSMGLCVTRFGNATTSDLARATVMAAVRADPGLDGLIVNDEVSALDVPEGELEICTV